MHLERLDLHDFRSYATARLELGPGVRVLVGANAQGKTNLLEAVHYLAIGGSHRVTADAPLVRTGADAAVVRAVARTDTAHGPGRVLTIELELRPGGRNRARVNGQPRARTADAIGQIRSVLFAPEDQQLVRGDPADRRRFLDELLTQRHPAYHAARQEYDRVLRQRNALLKTLRGHRGGVPPVGADPGTLTTWTDALVRTGATLLAARIAAVHALSGPADAAYRELVVDAPGGKSDVGISLTYLLSTGRRVPGEPGAGVPDPSGLADELRTGLQARAVEERERGMTLGGPHRDELVLAVGELPAKGYASHGESWSLALALRLASRDVLLTGPGGASTAGTAMGSTSVGEEPIVLLDDVFAELDETRRIALARRCEDFEQVLVTAAVDADVPLAGPRYAVRGGQVQPVDGVRR
jgi:DNA replication and repair protein RecF